MGNRQMVDAVYQRLVVAPTGLDCQATDVLRACAMLITAILRKGYNDPADRQVVVDWLIQGFTKATTELTLN
jgi:hypothetical protein